MWSSSPRTRRRAALTIRAAEAGVPGIIAEKPMPMAMGEARHDARVRPGRSKTILTHQRRMGSDLVEMPREMRIIAPWLDDPFPDYDADQVVACANG